MMYLIAAWVYSPAKTNLESILEKAASELDEKVLDSDQALQKVIEDMTRLKSVCNHNNRGPKIGFNYSEESRKMYIFVDHIDEIWSVTLRFIPIEKTLSVLDVDQIIETTLHDSDFYLFDCYLDEKEGGRL